MDTETLMIVAFGGSFIGAVLGSAIRSFLDI